MADFMKNFGPTAASMLSMGGQVAIGSSQQASANFTADQLNQQAGQTRASGQRQAIEDRRQAALANSRLQALTGAPDPGTAALAAGIAGEGEYRALSSLYQSEDRATGQEMQADAARLQGKQANQAGYIRGITSVLSGNDNGLFKKFANGGFNAGGRA